MEKALCQQKEQRRKKKIKKSKIRGCKMKKDMLL